MSQLPQYHQQLRHKVAAAANALDLYEKAIIAQTWGVATDHHGRTMAQVEAKAIATVERALLDLCEYAGVRSRQVVGLMEQVESLQQENRILTGALHRAAKEGPCDTP